MANASSTPQVYTYVDLGLLFAMPLLALIDADKYAAETFVEFIREFGFEGGDDPSDFGQLRMVSFTYTRPGPGGIPQINVVEVPLLSLIPLPALSIRNANVDFNVEILGAIAKPPEQPTGPISRARRRVSPSPLPMALASRMAPTTRTQSSASSTGVPEGSVPVSSQVHMLVKVNMGPSDLPEGITQMLNMMGQSTSDQQSTAPVIQMLPIDGNDTFTQLGERRRLRLRLLDERKQPLGAVRISLAQDAEAVFRLPTKEIVTDEQGEATAAVRLARWPADAAAGVAKTLWASAVVRGRAIGSMDATGSLILFVRNGAAAAQAE